MPLLAGLMCVLAAPLPALRHPIAVIGHRGGASERPENTLAAFRHAIEVGADYIEIDVRTTADGRLVLMHDRTVDRTTDGSGAVAELSFALIRGLDAGGWFEAAYAGERVPTFDEALELCRDRVCVYLDHKEAPAAELVEALRRHAMTGQVLVYNGPEELREWKRLAPEIPILPSPPDGAERPGALRAFIEDLQPEALDGHIREWTRAMVDEAHAAGAKVYTDIMGLTDNAEGWRRALELGVDGLQTDRPAALVAYLAAER